VKTQELIDKLVEYTQRYGDLDVIVWVSPILRFELKDVSPCTQRDHLLLSLGEVHVDL
jgi:hypothetical protein